MPRKVISIEIGVTNTKICEIDFKKKNPRVYNCVSFETPKNSYDDGYIIDKKTFAEVAKEVISTHKIKGNKVVFTISSTKIVNREVIIPFVKLSRIQDVIQANSSEYFPVDITDYILTYSILETIQEKDVKKLRLLVFAAPDNLIKNYYNIAELLGLEVMAIDYSGNSVYQVAKEQISHASMLIQLNEQSTLVNIIENGVLKLQRTVGFSSLSIIHTLMEFKDFNVDNEARAHQMLIKEKYILPMENLVVYEEAAASLNGMDDEIFIQKGKIHKLHTEILESMQYFIGNIQRILDYYYSKNKEKKIDAIYITGFGATFKGLDELLHIETGIPVKVIKYLPQVIFKKGYQNEGLKKCDYIACIGATLKPINFISKEHQLKYKKSTNMHILEIAGGALLVVCGILVGSAYFDYKSAKLDNESLKTELESIAVINEVYENHNKAKYVYEQVSGMDVLTKSPGIILGKLITELEKKLPRQTVIESFQFTKEGITLSMKCTSKEGVSKTLMQLKEITYLSNISTNGISQEEDENNLVTLHFIISASYNLTALTMEEEVNE